jgi:hypothetical protein
LQDQYFHENILFGHKFGGIIRSAHINVFLVSTVRSSLRTSKDTATKLNNISYEYHYFGASTVTVADLVMMAVLSVTNVGSVN